MLEPMPMEYASDALEQPADRLLRRIIGWLAIAYAGMALGQTSLQVALAKGWMATPRTMAWGFRDGLDVAVTAARALIMCALVVGGVLMLRRSPASVAILRGAAVCTVTLAVLGLVMNLRASSVAASYWSTPAAAAVSALQFLGGLWLPVVIALLTLPPLARRIV